MFKFINYIYIGVFITFCFPRIILISDSSSHPLNEFLQYFGTNICRKIKPNIWVDSCIQRMLESGTELAIVPDVRFPNEAEAIKKAGGRVIRLTRSPHEDEHESETALNDYEGFDHVLDNANANIDDTNRAIMEVLRGWGWLQTKGS